MLNWATAGLIAGAGFSVALGIAARHRTLTEIPVEWAALWGAVGTVVGTLVLMPLLLLVVPGLIIAPFLVVAAMLGAASAAGTLVLARRAEDHELLEAREDAHRQIEGE